MIDTSKLKELAIAARDYTAELSAVSQYHAAANPAAILELLAELDRAHRALVRGGFEDRGGEEWAPPIGPKPRFVATSAELEAARNAALEEAATECERMKMYPGGRQECQVYGNVWDAASGIRALATTSTEPAKEAAKSGAAALTDSEIIDIARQFHSWGFGYRQDDSGAWTIPNLPNCIEDYTRAIETELASRGAAQGRITQDNGGGSSPADAGGLTPGEIAELADRHDLKRNIFNSDYHAETAFVRDVESLLATKAAQPDQARRVVELASKVIGVMPCLIRDCREGSEPVGKQLMEAVRAFGASPAPSAKQEPSDKVASEKEALRRLSVQGMADCMDMVRSDLVQMGVIDKSVAPMFIPEAVAAYVNRLAATSASASPAAPDGFKNFHRSLCARFGYTHDEQFWWRDLVSLEEHIAAWIDAPVAGSQQSVVELLSKALEDIAQPANAGCGCDFPCQCETDAAEAINAGAMRDIAHEALKAAALAAAAPAVPVPVDQDQARDAARYRWLRDSPWSFDRPELAQIIQLQQNARWDAEIDAAMAAPSLQQPKEGSQP